MKLRYAIISGMALSPSLVSAAVQLTTLFQFNGTNGAIPTGGLILDGSGNLYGTTFNGGTHNLGTVFQLTPNGTLNTVVNFNGADGYDPASSLTVDQSGNLFGTTEEFNTSAYGPTQEYGSVYEVAAGTLAFSTLANFNGKNGEFVQTELTLDESGNIYGVAYQGGNLSLTSGSGDGTIFRVDADTHNLTNPYIFDGSAGILPTGGIAMDSSGNLYGKTANGGNGNSGTIYELPAGSNEIKTLAQLNATDGVGNLAGSNLLIDSHGNLYGETAFGGTIFELRHGATSLTTLHTLTVADGRSPDGTLIMDQDGNLFGTTSYGGQNNDGTVFELNPTTGVFTTLVSLSGANVEPIGALTFDSAGDLYGTTAGNGQSSLGTIFEITGSGAVVPEPASLSLLGIAGLGLLARRRVG